MAKLNGILRSAGNLACEAVYRGVSIAKSLKRSDEDIGTNSPNPIEFTYIGTDGEGEYVGKMFYSDDYFSISSEQYNNRLATASIAVALSCGNSFSGYHSGYVNVHALLHDMGFDDIEHNEAYEALSSLETIAVAIGSRSLPDSTLICVGIRGIGYGSEWGANLMLGTGIYHQGFDEASNRVLRYLREYLGKKQVTGRIKLWVTGYSRSASTANLVAGKIDTALAEGTLCDVLGDGVEVSLGDIYAYCFEPAETVMSTAFDLHGPDYRNIWNHINPNDPIPIMVTSCFGMERFGTDLRFPCVKDANYRGRRDRMLEFYRRLPNREQIGIYRTDFFKTLAIKSLKNEEKGSWGNQVDFLAEVNSRLAQSIQSREYYVENLQAGLSKFVAKHNSYEGSERFRECLRQTLGENKVSLVSAINRLEKDDIENVRYFMRRPVRDALVRANLDVGLTDEMTDAVTELMVVFKDFIKDHKMLTFNFLFNAKTIFFAHYPELIFAWLMSTDPNYKLP